MPEPVETGMCSFCLRPLFALKARNRAPGNLRTFITWLGPQIPEQYDVGLAFSHGGINRVAIRRPGNPPRNESGLAAKVRNAAHRSSGGRLGPDVCRRSIRQ